MRHVTFVLSLLSVLWAAGASAGEDLRIRDRFGNQLGTIEPIPGDNLAIRDRYGRQLGTIEPKARGGAEVRDRYGNRTGTLERGRDSGLSILETLVPPRARR